METLTTEHKKGQFDYSDEFKHRFKSKYSDEEVLYSEDYTITPTGITLNNGNETWDIVNDIYACVKEIGPQKTILQCILDQEKRIFQDRFFDTSILSKIVNLKQGQLILIKQRQGLKGKEYHNLLSFSDGTGLLSNPERFFNTTTDENKKLNPEIFGTPLR